MKKSLIAAAVIAAVAAPSANAAVTIYGKIHASIDMVDEPHTGEAWYVANRGSYIGFKGTEDLGNGLNLIWQAETGYDITDGNNWESARNSYIGLSGDWGTFLYGIHDTPLYMSTASLDLFDDQIGDYNWSADPNSALFGPGFHDVTANNAIAYISPNMNGLTFAGAVIPGEGVNGNDGLADSYSVAAMYSNNGLFLSAAYEELAEGSLNGAGIGSLSPSLAPSHVDILASDGLKKWRVGAGFTMNALTLGVVYENHEMEALTDGTVNDYEDYSADLWQVSAAYDFGNTRFKVAYGQNEGESIDIDTLASVNNYTTTGESSHWAIGLDHKLSKRTMIYAAYAQSEIEDMSVVQDGTEVREFEGGDFSGFSLGMMHNF